MGALSLSQPCLCLCEASAPRLPSLVSVAWMTFTNLSCQEAELCSEKDTSSELKRLSQWDEEAALAEGVSCHARGRMS